MALMREVRVDDTLGRVCGGNSVVVCVVFFLFVCFLSFCVGCLIGRGGVGCVCRLTTGGTSQHGWRRRCPILLIVLTAARFGKRTSFLCCHRSISLARVTPRRMASRWLGYLGPQALCLRLVITVNRRFLSGQARLDLPALFPPTRTLLKCLTTIRHCRMALLDLRVPYRPSVNRENLVPSSTKLAR
jgi:hypothetical protein